MQGKWLISAMQEQLCPETAIRHFFNTPGKAGPVEKVVVLRGGRGF